MTKRLVRLVATAALTLAACASDGRELQVPDTATTTQPPAVDRPAAGSESTDATDFAFRADAFGDGAPIPVEFTCDGLDRSPALTWERVPFGAAELAVVVTDQDTPQRFVHWVITGLSPGSTGLAVDEVPDGAVEARNGFGTLGWAGPCPPAAHTYQFALHVLPEPLGMVPDLDATTAVGLVESATIQVISFTATFGPATS